MDFLERRREVLLAAGLFALLTVVPGTVFAHDTWMTPARRLVPPGTILALDLTSGMAFPALDYAIEPDRVDRAVCRLGGKVSEIDQRQKSAHSMRLEVRLDTAGIAAISVDLKPKSIDLNPDEVGEYLDEINAPEAIRRAWSGVGGQKRWLEIYTKHSKAFVRVGDPQTDRSWAEPIGTALEFVPEEDPTMLQVGDELHVRVLKRGAPLPHFSVGIVPAGDPRGSQQSTDGDGRIVVRLDRAGPWLLRGTEIRKTSTGEADWESDFTTLTIEVRPR